MINFVSYDMTGKLLSAGYMSDVCLAAAVDAGDRILPIGPVESFDLAKSKVDLSKMQLVGVMQKAAPATEQRAEHIDPISDKQFYTKAAIRGMISQDDAVKAVQSGFIPAPMQAFIDALQDAETRFAATMLFGGETTLYWQHPLIQSFLMGQGMDADAMKQFFREAAVL